MQEEFQFAIFSPIIVKHPADVTRICKCAADYNNANTGERSPAFVLSNLPSKLANILQLEISRNGDSTFNVHVRTIIDRLTLTQRIHCCQRKTTSLPLKNVSSFTVKASLAEEETNDACSPLSTRAFSSFYIVEQN